MELDELPDLEAPDHLPPLRRRGTPLPAASRSLGAVRLGEARGERSVCWLGRELGISHSFAWNLVHGHRRPSVELALRIRDRFGVALDLWTRLAA
jgi:hypothetical protein